MPIQRSFWHVNGHQHSASGLPIAVADGTFFSVVQPTQDWGYPTLSVGGYLVTLALLAYKGFRLISLKRSGSKFGMLRLTNFDGSQRQRWCAVVVLFAVCALTVSVTTRYTLSRGVSDNSVKTVRKHVSPEQSRQRLLKNAATWMPPVVSSSVLQAPTFYPRIAPAGPPIPRLFFEQNLYNRPPPSSKFLA